MELNFDLSKYMRLKRPTHKRDKEPDPDDIPLELRNLKEYHKNDCVFYMHGSLMFNNHGMIVIPVVHKGKKSIVCRHKEFNHIIHKRIDTVLDDQIEMMLKDETQGMSMYNRLHDAKQRRY